MSANIKLKHQSLTLFTEQKWGNMWKLLYRPVTGKRLVLLHFKKYWFKYQQKSPTYHTISFITHKFITNTIWVFSNKWVLTPWVHALAANNHYNTIILSSKQCRKRIEIVLRNHVYCTLHTSASKQSWSCCFRS